MVFFPIMLHVFSQNIWKNTNQFMECETAKVPPYNAVINSFHSNSKFTEAYKRKCLPEVMAESRDDIRVGATTFFIHYYYELPHTV